MIQAQAGHKESYRTLLQTVRPMACGLAKILLSSSGKKYSLDPEDVAQDVLLALHKQLKTYRPEHAFLPWFKAIVRHRTIDLLRAHRPTENIEDHVDDLAAATEDFSQELRQIRFSTLLRGLPPKLKRILQLTKVEGRSVSEVSQILNISESDVKVSTFRAIQNLKKAGKEDHEE